ncbi:MAG TPA: outer membrane lipoprotein carrier protein LolA [Bryobacteraceae bacterium]|nr:outer membrane lipoprotein carrier protein LolA [Bryobacteraceae bacterium]
MNPHVRTTLLYSTTVVLFTLPIAAQTAAAVLSRLDSTSAGFRSATANIERVTHTAIINESLTETGTLRMLRNKGTVQLYLEFTKPDAKTYAFRERKAEVYFPKILTVQEYDVGKQKGIVEQFILLGFGTSGKDLAKGYNVKFGGEESIGGQTASRLELTPKSAKTREYFTKVELWINAEGRTVRQKFYQPSGDTTTVTYSNLVWNPALTPDALSLKLPAGVKREYPQR